MGVAARLALEQPRDVLARVLQQHLHRRRSGLNSLWRASRHVARRGLKPQALRSAAQYLPPPGVLEVGLQLILLPPDHKTQRGLGCGHGRWGWLLSGDTCSCEGMQLGLELGPHSPRGLHWVLPSVPPKGKVCMLVSCWGMLQPELTI